MRENVRLYKGDCIEELKKVEDRSVDMILTDLPYGITKNEWDKKIDIEVLWKEYKRVLKERGVVLLFGMGLFSTELIMSNKSWYRYSLVRDKCAGGGFLNANRMPLRRHEDILVFYKKAPVYNPQKSKGKRNHRKGKKIIGGVSKTNNNYGEFKIVENIEDSEWKYPTSILSYRVVAPSKRLHPTEKPIELLSYLIRTYTNEGDVVLDSCMGCGGVGIASVENKRCFIGIEKESKFFNQSVERIRKASGRECII